MRALRGGRPGTTGKEIGRPEEGVGAAKKENHWAYGGLM